MINATDMQSCYRLVGDCRDLGADPLDWQERLLDGLRDLLHAQVVIGGNMLGFDPGRKPKHLLTLRRGWPTSQAEAAWRDFADTVPMEYTAEFKHLAGFHGSIITCTRDEIWDRASWYRSTTFNDRHRAAGIDHYVISVHVVPGTSMYHSLWVHRALGDKAFGDRERTLLHTLHAEIGRLIGSALADAREPTLRTLSARQREVLARLLTGDAEKEAAAHLGITTATLHEHVGALYTRFGVRSRAELMARFIGRARPALSPVKN